MSVGAAVLTGISLIIGGGVALLAYFIPSIDDEYDGDFSSFIDEEYDGDFGSAIDEEYDSFSSLIDEEYDGDFGSFIDEEYDGDFRSFIHEEYDGEFMSFMHDSAFTSYIDEEYDGDFNSFIDAELGSEMSPREDFLSTVGSYGIFSAVVGSVVVMSVIFLDLSPSKIGLSGPSTETVMVGIGAGVVLFGIDLALMYGLKAAGFDLSHRSEEQTPETLSGAGWNTAGFSVQAPSEELLYRVGLVGAPAVLFAVSPWYFVVPAAALFGGGHADSGSAAAISATLIGVGYGAVFVVGGLVASALAHIITNSLVMFTLVIQK